MTVVSLVEPRILTHLGPLITNPPTDGTAFASIKKSIVDRYVSTAAERIRKVLSEVTLGDKRPSHLLDEMSALSDGKIGDPVLIQLWKQRLPQDVQKILSCVPETTSKVELAQTADRILEVESQRSPSSSIAAVSLPAAQVKSSEPFAQILEMITNKFEKLESDLRSRHAPTRSRSRTRSTSASRATVHTNAEGNAVCFYHHKYGTRARNCREPCFFRKTSQDSRPK